MDRLYVTLPYLTIQNDLCARANFENARKARVDHLTHTFNIEVHLPRKTSNKTKEKRKRKKNINDEANSIY